MTTTKKGRLLAAELGHAGQHEEACSLLMRAATTYQRLQEEECNGPHWAGVEFPGYTKRMDDWQTGLEKRQEQCAALIEKHAARIPSVRAVHLSGDPRGVCVKLERIDGRNNSFAGGLWCVPLEG